MLRHYNCMMATKSHSMQSVSHVCFGAFCSLHGRLVLTANVIAEGARKVLSYCQLHKYPCPVTSVVLSSFDALSSRQQT